MKKTFPKSILIFTLQAFLPLASKRILEYSLEWLSHSGVQETILYCASHADTIDDFLRLVSKFSVSVGHCQLWSTDTNWHGIESLINYYTELLKL